VRFIGEVKEDGEAAAEVVVAPAAAELPTALRLSIVAPPNSFKYGKLTLVCIVN
jgi:hypothetical protein